MLIWKLGLALCGALACGCTFYTSCPTGNGNGNGNQGGTGSGGSPSGGSSNGGSSNDGGVGGGTPVLVGWQNVTNNLAGKASSCGGLSVLVAKRDMVLAGINQQGLWATTDGGDRWYPLGQGDGSEPITAGVRSITIDPDDADSYWLSCLYGERGIWHTADNGDTFKILGGIRHNDAVAVDFTDPDRKTLVAGGHEIQKTVWRTANGGDDWSQIGTTLPSDSKASSYPFVLGPDEYLLGAAGYADGLAGIFRTENGGEDWERVSDIGGYGQPLSLDDGTLLWTGETGALARSTDRGLTWEEVMPTDSIYGYQSLHQLPDGRFVFMSRYDGMKVMEEDFTGARSVTERVPFDTTGFTYSVLDRAFFAWHNDCSDLVLDDAVMRADWDYENEPEPTP